MKIRGLFWKIFFAFWVANILIVTLTSYFLFSSLEAKNLKKRHQDFIEGIALTIIDRYENDGRKTSRKTFNELLGDAPLFHETIWRRQFRILKNDGEVIFRNRFRRRKGSQQELFTFSIRSKNQGFYQVESYINRPPPFIVENLKKINYLRFFIVFIASAAVSFLLSWSFSRPLGKLGALSRRYANGETTLEIDSSLLKRHDEIGDLARDLDYMGSQVEKNISRQKQLLHDVSHELRAPLARLQAAAGLLEQRASGNTHEIDRIHQECTRIDDLIQQILKYSRAEHLFDEKITIELMTFLQQQLDIVALEFPTHTLNLKTSAEKFYIRASKPALDAAVHNILVNACKYSSQLKPVDVFFTLNESSVDIIVRDYGEGVDERELSKLVTPFYRSGNKMHVDGFGLGLSIAQRAARANGGDIVMRNHEAGGLEVCLSVATCTKHEYPDC